MKNSIIILLSFIYLSSNAQSVGIGTLTPHASAILDLTSSDKGFLAPRMRTVDRIAIANPEEGLLVFDMNTLSFWVWRGVPDGSWTELSTTFNGIWQKNGTKIYNTNGGFVGIGTENPQSHLHIDGNSVSSELQLSLANVKTATIRGVQGVNYSGLELKAVKSDGHILMETDKTRLKLHSGQTSVTIGPSSWLGPTLIVSDEAKDPEIRFQRVSFGDPDPGWKGFVQIAGDNLRIGTHGDNVDGKFIIRTNLGDRVAVDKNGNMGVGTLSPATRLDVGGDINVTGEVRNASKTGAANLLPICYGNVKSDGTINTGSNNFTVNRTSVGRYVITITGYAFSYLTYLATVTPSFLDSPQLAVTSSFNGDLIVRIFNLAGNLVDGYFNFVVHKP